MTTLRARCATFVLALIVFGCGSSGSDSAAPPKTSPDASVSDAGPEDAATPSDATPDVEMPPVDAPYTPPSTATVVYSDPSRSLAGLALSGGTLYVSVQATQTAEYPGDGRIISIPKTATNASLAAGSTTVIPNITPRGLTVYDGQLYWDNGTWGASFTHILTAPVSGGTPAPIIPGDDAVTPPRRFVVANSVMYLNKGTEIWAWPIGSQALPTVYFPYRSDPLSGIESDGTNIYFFLGGFSGLDLCATTVGELHGVTLLASNVRSSSFRETAYMLSDETTIYWLDGVAVYSLPKQVTAESEPTLLGTLPNGGVTVQLLADGSNLYVLSETQLGRIPKTGGTPVILHEVTVASLTPPATNALAMATDETFIYWLDAQGGKVLRAPK